MPQQTPTSQLQFTLREFAAMLNPPMSEQQLRYLVRALNWQPTGVRLTGTGGHPRQTFGADDLRRAYAAVAPLLHDSGVA